MQRPNPETVTLNDILITEELSRRAPRPPNWQAEAEAMRSLGRQMAQASEILMQTLVDTALELCQAGTTGVSLLETTPDGTEIFRVQALAGTLAHYVGGSIPRDFSPCGVCLEQGSPVLFSYPERYFTYFQEANTPPSAEHNSVGIVEGLVLPLIADSHVLGTIWIMSHDEGRQFDSEDVRVMTSLADFTATALLLQRQTRELLARQVADLIEQRQTEGDLRESEARLQSIANLVPDLLWDSEPDGSTNWYNQRWLEYTGQTFEQAIGWGWMDAIHPDDREGSARCYREAVEQGTPLQQEQRIRRHDGAYRWFVVKASPLKDERGKVIKMYGAATDIHEQRVALEALRESESKYRSLFNSMDEAYAVVEVLADHNGEWNDFLFLEVNPAFEQQSGMVNSVGRKATEILGTPNPAWAKIYGQVAQTGEPIRFEANEATLDRIFDLYAFRLGEAGSHRVAVLFTDITERKRMAEALAELDRAKTVFFTQVSHEFRTPLTLSLAPLQDALSDQVHPLDPVQRERLELIHRNSLRLLKLVNTLLDFSRIEARRMEAVYEPTDLATYTAELASVFRSAIERAGLQLMVDCPPLPEPVFVDREMWEKIVLNLLSNAFKFTFEGEITVSMRIESRIERQASTSNIDKLTSDPHTLTSELDISTSQPQGSSSGLEIPTSKLETSTSELGTLTSELDTPTSELDTLTSELETSSSELETPPLEKQTTTSNLHVILEIHDTGTGIAPEHLPHLFERFYQVQGTQARTHEGSGIGLALANELVRLQGGTIEVSSTVGEGTCFTIALPFGTDHLPSNLLQNEGAPRSGTVPDRSPIRTLSSTAMSTAAYVEEAKRWLPEGGNREELTPTPYSLPSTPLSARVLIVDDNADMREYLTRILNEHVQVEAVADGAMALAAAQEQVPDLILSDVMMPGLDGFELLEALRADPRTREVPIILLSARAGEEAIVEGLEAGADDYLIKPFSAQELVSRIIAHLQMAQLRGEALQEARSTLRSRDESISIVSHELNTPLVSILGWTRLLRSSPPNPVMLSKALDTIERNATLQAKLVQDLLDVSRISAGKLRLNPQPIELQPVIETAIATVTQTAANKDIHLTLQKNVTEPVVVMGDGDRLSQVLINLLTNAIKFTPESGSVKVELSVMNNDCSADASYAEIRVIDTGIGIAADFLPHVFERFRQAEGAYSAKGLGLGLAIAYHLVTLHNGTIQAESAGEKQGTTLIVRLPLL
ncbi:MAG TPA: ATP-binding protein [Trichocoleus sp.]